MPDSYLFLFTSKGVSMTAGTDKIKELRQTGQFHCQNAYRKGLDSTSLRESINAHCAMCMGCNLNDTCEADNE